MKQLYFFSLTFFWLLLGAQQKPFVLIDVQTQKQFLKKDSAAAVKFLDSLAQNHYYLTKLQEVKKNGQTTEIYFDKGKNYNQGWVQVSDTIAAEFRIARELYIKNMDSLKFEVNRRYLQKGFAFNRVKSKFNGLKEGWPVVALSVSLEQQRSIDGFTLKGYEKVPRRFIKNLEKEFRGRSFNDKNTLAIQSYLQNQPFVTLERQPQTLFTKDSTRIFLFLQKRKSNTFDGMLGFGNTDTNKLTFTGNLNLQFRNIFNAFESIGINWQRNPDKSQIFNLQTDFPYVFNSNIGTAVSLNISRQDSAYANVKLMPGLYLNLGFRQKIGLKGTFETSSVADTLFTQARDFSKKGIGIWYIYTAPTDIELFLHKTYIAAEADFFHTTYGASKGTNNTQTTHFAILAEHNALITGQHWIHGKIQSAGFTGNSPLAPNELLRFGGWSSMRGFSENAIFANSYYFGMAEYRYLIGRQAFFDAFGQLGKFSNKTLGLHPYIYSFGVGFNYFLPIGLMSLQISNGGEFGTPLRLGSTKIHWGLLSRF